MRWAEIEIEATREATDAVGNVLSVAGCAGFVARDEGITPSVVGYLPVDDRLEGRLNAIQGDLRTLAGFGVEGAGTELTVRFVEEEDWANAWKAFFKPIPVGRRLLVTPPWEHPELATETLPIIIDPGMAFGTGSHPTTQLCLAALEEFVPPGGHVADIGAGSGILAIAAAKLGAARVYATDNDPLTLPIARTNATVNGVEILVEPEPPTGTFDVVVANILADVIIGMADDLAGWVAPGGTLITSGIIDTREADVRAALEQRGLTLTDVRNEAEWVALIHRRPR